MHCAREAIKDEARLTGCHAVIKALGQETKDNIIRQQLSLAH
jgi:hypothetical protein